MIGTRNDGSHERHWFMRLVCLHFGGRTSPYIANQMQARIMGFALGHHSDENPAFVWRRVMLNLPTMMNWDPSIPQVLLLYKDYGLASQQVWCVDNIHLTSLGTSDHRQEQLVSSCAHA